MMLPAAVGKDSGVVNFMSVFSRGYFRRQRDSSFVFEIDVTPRIMPRVYDIM
jgi:hypothetical protein